MTHFFRTKSYCNHLGILLFVVWLICSTCYAISGINKDEMEVQCVPKERDALLQFKHGILIDHCGLLASWGGSLDCCQWHGIRCDNFTGHVNRLQLRGFLHNDDDGVPIMGQCLEGSLGVSLAELKHLKYLDLSLNNFQMQSIPKFIGSLSNLRHLNLSNSGFHGVIPPEIGNLSRLYSLDLNCLYKYKTESILSVKSLSCLSQLRSLRNINLGGIDLSLVSNWISIVNNLPFLEVLRMDECLLTPKLPSSFSYTNSSKTLHVISLSWNDLDNSIYHWFYNLSKSETTLSYLDLSYNQFSEEIPPFIWKMKSLSFLDLSGNTFSGKIPLFIWNMTSLSYLDLSLNSFSGEIPSELGSMMSLSYLSVESNRLEGRIPNTISNLQHLVVLDLSFNNKLEFNRDALKSLGKLCHLQALNLNSAIITYDLSQIIDSLSPCACKSLVTLDLSNTQVWGSVPNGISAFSSLEELYVSDNQLNGTNNEGIGQLSRLETLDLSNNSLKGILSHNHFSNLSRLSYLDLSYNQGLVLNLSDDWSPPFQLDTLKLGQCKMRANHFPNWLLTQKNITTLDISEAGIYDTIPEPFWNSLLSFHSSSSPDLRLFNISNNMIHGVLPDLSFTFTSVIIVDMSSNNLNGVIPSFLRNNVSELYLNDNKLSQGLSRFLCPKTETALEILDLSNNMLSETLPDCWRYFPNLYVLKLNNNNITGNLPSSIASLGGLQLLRLRNNNLYGELPMSWVNSSALAVLDLAYNSLTGSIPPNFGQDLGRLNVPSLRNNKFSMEIPSSLCQLQCLQILDLSHNKISGSLPKCLYNLTAMVEYPNIIYVSCFEPTGGIETYLDKDFGWFTWKGKERSLSDLYGIVAGIDISDNHLQGRIPDEFSRLVDLVFLNLSRNQLSGLIPSKIGNLTSLQFLDLSHNHLSGEIPTSLASITYLELLGLSNNNLSGKIPLGTQLQTFDASSYIGNPGLCGTPLPECPGDQATHFPQDEDNIAQRENHETDDFFLGLMISVVLGFISGFWGVCGTLVLKRSWRHAFFRFYDDTKDRVYVMVAVCITRARRRS